MNNSTKIDEYYIESNRISIITLESIFKNYIEIPILNDLNQYGLLKEKEIDLRNRDTKRLLYHHIVLNVCEAIIYSKQQHKADVVIVYSNIFSDSSEICTFIQCDKLYTQIIRILKKIESNLHQIIIHTRRKITNDFLQTGEGMDFLGICDGKILKSSNKSNLSLDKILEFGRKNGLTFLTESYFHQIRSTSLLLQ